MIFTSRATIHGKVVPTIHEKVVFYRVIPKNAQNEPQKWPYLMKPLRKHQNKAVFWPKK